MLFIGLPILIAAVLTIVVVLYNRRHGRPALMPPGDLSADIVRLEGRLEAVERRLAALEGEPADAGPHEREGNER